MPTQIDTDTRPAHDRYDALRRTRTCPLCHNHKDAALLVCWTCYRAHDIRNGMQPATAQIIDDAADTLNEAQKPATYEPCNCDACRAGDGH